MKGLFTPLDVAIKSLLMHSATFAPIHHRFLFTRITISITAQIALKNILFTTTKHLVRKTKQHLRVDSRSMLNKNHTNRSKI